MDQAKGNAERWPRANQQWESNGSQDQEDAKGVHQVALP